MFATSLTRMRTRSRPAASVGMRRGFWISVSWYILILSYGLAHMTILVDAWLGLYTSHRKRARGERGHPADAEQRYGPVPPGLQLP